MFIGTSLGLRLGYKRISNMDNSAALDPSAPARARQSPPATMHRNVYVVNCHNIQ